MNGREVNMEAEKVVQQATMIAHWAQKLGCPIGYVPTTKSGLPNRLCHQPHNNDIYTILACNISDKMLSRMATWFCHCFAWSVYIKTAASICASDLRFP